jgi:hypothetical protein
MIKETGYRQGFPNISRTEFAVDTDEATPLAENRAQTGTDFFRFGL